MDKWLKSPWFIRIISLLLAILLYASVNLDDGASQSNSILPEGNKEVTTMNNIPLQVYMNDEKYVVEGVPQNVTVTVEGPNTVVTKTITQKNFDVFIDLQELEPGTHTVPIEHRGISNQLSVFVEPEEVEVSLEERSSKAFDVEIDFMNRDKIGDGFEIGDPTVEPEKVEITGSKSEIDKVSLVKAIVDVSEASESISKKDAPVKVYDQQGNELNVFVEPSSVKVSAPIIPPNKEVPLSIQTEGELPEGYSVNSIKANPNKVRVFGSSEQLESIKTIDNMTIDLSTIKADKTLDMDVTVPNKANKVEPSTVQVEVDIEESTTKTFENSKVNVQNLQENQTITFIEPEDQTIDLTLIGTAKELENVNQDQFEAYINVEQFVEGEFSVPIEVNGPAKVKWELSNKEAQVRIE
ncbi:CdaR family protein [Pontibacillus yanchengensis]|nr:CdaR family protein [Pontibacillus yanchengensis]